MARKHDGSGAEATDRAEGESGGGRERLRRDLEARGVDPLFTDAVVARVERRTEEASRASLDAVIDGVELAYHVHRRGQDDLRQSVRDLNEVACLMEDFGGELKKLDETLKILATFLGRMRNRIQREDEAILH